MKKHKINRWKRTGNYTFQKQLPIRDNRNIYDPMIGDSEVEILEEFETYKDFETLKKLIEDNS